MKEKFNKEIEDGIVEINKGYSTTVLDSFDDNYFDWVYIDSSHSYEVTKQELKVSERKVKYNGIISGHDYVTRTRTGAMKYGVIEAVHEFCVVNNYEIVYMTLEWSGHNSFALSRIN